MGFFQFTNRELLRLLFRQTSAWGTISAPPALWAGFSSTEPDPDGGNITEPAEASYARVALTLPADMGDASDADPSEIANAAVKTFPAPLEDWAGGAALGWGVLWDAATLGNPVHWGAIGSPRPVLAGDPAPAIPIGALVAALSDETGAEE